MTSNNGAGNIRRARFLAIPVCCALLLLLAACGQAEIQGLKLNPSPWQDGETSLYRVTDEQGVYVGTMQYDIDAVGDDGWTLRREIVVPGSTEIVAIEASEEGLRPRRSLLMRTEADGRESSEATYQDGQADIKLTTKKDVTSYERMNVPSDARDQHTLVMLARRLPLADNYAVRVNSFLPIAGLLERVTVRTIDEEQVDTPAGRFDTWVVELDFGDSEIRAWIAKEAPFPLVRYEDERAQGVFELTEFQPGQ